MEEVSRSPAKDRKRRSRAHRSIISLPQSAEKSGCIITSPGRRRFRFKPKGGETSVGDFTEELKALATLRKTFVVETAPDEDKPLGGESTCVDKDTYEDLVSALRNLGYPAKRARQRIDRAIETLESKAEPVTEEKILTVALRGDS